MIKRYGNKKSVSEFRHRIALRNNIQTRNPDGSINITKIVSKECWAAIYPISSKQVFEYKSINIEASHLIKIRGKIEISENTQDFLFKNREFEILTVENLQERNIISIIMCKERN